MTKHADVRKHRTSQNATKTTYKLHVKNTAMFTG